ncbi:MAG: hypothetical protein JWN52_1642 [Actinomycetia bacterium]|nr:hypothetical protein [Actinomycetes bacterium]
MDGLLLSRDRRSDSVRPRPDPSGVTVRKMMITRLTSAVAALDIAMAAMPSAGAATRHWPVDLGVSVAGNHRQPVPGEIQVLRWTVDNVGGTALDRVRLDVRVPPDWLLRDAVGCQADGSLLRCSLGTLAPGGRARATIRMAVPAHPRLGSVLIPGRTSALVGGEAVAGPSTALRVIVVLHR